MKRIKENKGITLIALIITIIVMLILVGVTVSVALNGGLFKKAQEAVNRTQYEVDKEILQETIIGVLDKNIKIPSEEEIMENLPNGWEMKYPEEGEYVIIVSPNKNEFKVNENGIVDEATDSEEEWWELRPGEAEEFEKNGSQASNGNILAMSSDNETYVGFYDMGNGDPIDGFLMRVKKGETVQSYICHIGENTLNIYDGEYEKGQWYAFDNGTYGNLIKYTGPSPIQLSDFTGGMIACQTYMERIIASFSN